MRTVLYRFMSRPWVYRITCLVLFVAVMAAFRFGLHVAQNTMEQWAFVALCVSLFVTFLACGFLVERRERRH